MESVSMKKRRLGIVTGASSLLFSPATKTGEVKVASAADLTFVMKASEWGF